MRWGLGVTSRSSESTGFRTVRRNSTETGVSGTEESRASQTSNRVLWLARSFASDEVGQGTVEAAVTIPAVMLVLALLMQPVCLSYTRMVMRGAAGDLLSHFLTRDGELIESPVEERLIGASLSTLRQLSNVIGMPETPTVARSLRFVDSRRFPRYRSFMWEGRATGRLPSIGRTLMWR